ncbi:hypothetical protein RvY_02340 [Ramazzottius varieornatus]|uniref:ARID domain-containing protein n=1 Tax=Ramazzottius varieornatus TaxID=947166 RepID=A0A1D1UUI3_RAMVA|nr:hypothetical protein RvY_02340 [Ramazzottius varieornatus]
MPPQSKDEPVVLVLGTEVSARFNGAFCEAKIRSLTPDVKLRVRPVPEGDVFTVRSPNIITELKDIRVDGEVTVRHPTTEATLQVIVLQSTDFSTYVVDFNDGDEKKLKRNSLLLKSGKHFDQSISLDNLPLTQPEKMAASTSGAAEDAPSKKRSGRNDSIVSGETDDSSDVESVRRSVRQRRPVTYTSTSNNGRKERLPKVDESDSSQSSLKDIVSMDESTDLNAPSTSKASEPEKAKEVEKLKDEAVATPADVKPERDRIELTQVVQPQVKRRVGRPPSNKSKAAKALAAEEAISKEVNATGSTKETDETEVNAASAPESTVKPTLDVPSAATRAQKDTEKETARTSPRRRLGDSETTPEVPAARLHPPANGTVKPEPREPLKEEVVPAAAATSSDATGAKGPTLQEEYPVKTVVCVLQNGRKKCKWLPGVVVHPESRKKSKVTDGNEVLIRLFSNSSYIKARRDQVKLFHEGVYTFPDEDRVLKSDSALLFFREQILPPTWSTSMFLPVEAPRESSEDGNEDAASTRDDDEEESEANRFMIQFIKWSDERGHPYDNAAMVEDKPVDMYKLYKAVHNAGGYNKCNQENKWEDIREELGFAMQGTSAPVLKEIYQKYLHGHGGFESIYRSLGSSVTDIRLGRKRYTTQESRNSVPPPDHFESLSHSPVPKKRPTSPQQGGKKRRGRPPASVARELNTTADGRLILSVNEPKAKRSKAPTSTSDVPVEEGPGESIASTSKVDRSISEESGDVAPAGDAGWMAMRDKAVPDTPQITDPSVLKPGAIVTVLYRKVKKGPVPIAYPARIVDNVGNVAFYVHYEGWNKRYDEWVPLAAITGVVSLTEVGPSTLNSSQLSKIRAPLRRAEWSTYRAQLDKAMNLSPSNDHSMADTASTTSATSEHPEAVPESTLPSKGILASEEDKVKVETAETAKAQRKRSRSDSTSALAVPEVPKRARVPSAAATRPAVEDTVPEMKKSKSAGETVPREKSPLKTIPEESSDVARSSAPAKEAEKVPSTSKESAGDTDRLAGEEVKPRKSKSGKGKGKVDKKKVKSDAPEVKPSEQSGVAANVVEVVTLKVEEVDSAVVVQAQEKPAEEQVRESKKRKKSRSKKGEDALTVSVEEAKSTSGSASPTSRDAGGIIATTTTPATGLVDAKKGVVEEEKYVSVLALDKPAKTKKARKSKEVAQETKAAEPALEATPKPRAAPTSESALIRVEHLLRPAEPQEPAPARPVPAPPRKKKEKTQAASTVPKIEERPQQELIGPPSASLPAIVVDHTPTADRAAVSEETASKEPAKEKRGKADRPSKKGKKEAVPEPTIELPLKAPHFASIHSAALERLGLPLDGSESGKETVTVEDEFGSFARLVIEGVDLTDPDVLHTGAATLTGAARIEAYEQCLNDTLLISQLLIHRLATGYHILKRSEELQQDLQGVKKEDVAPNVSVAETEPTDVKKSSLITSGASGRGRPPKSKL